MPDYMSRKIILIMTDPTRKDRLGCYGIPDMKTPRLNRLASRGIRFERAYTCQPVCGPARAGIFTGTFPHSNGSWANTMALGDNVRTIGQRLRDNGIHTGYIGKWHLDGGDYFGLGRCPDGWDKSYWYDMRNYLSELSEKDRIRSRRTETNRDPELREDFTFGHRCSNRAIDFLDKHHDEDFFLVVSYDEPHGPCLCPKPYSAMYDGYQFPKSRNIWDSLEGKPEHQRIWGGNSIRQDKDSLTITPADFFGCNSFVDYEIGRVLEAIDRYASDALVIYTSDHGAFLSSHSLSGKGPAMYDEITNVPFIIRWPERIPEECVYNYPVSHIDILPTVMEVMGLKIPKPAEGRSLLPLLRSTDVRVNEVVFMEFSRYEIDHDGFGGFQPIRCSFNGRFKLTINLLTTDELYDLKNDREEMVNLIDSDAHTEIRDRLHDEILNWMNETRDPFRGYYWERRPWRKNAREATWDYTLMTRQRENEEYEPRQLDYGTGLEMKDAVRKK